MSWEVKKELDVNILLPPNNRAMIAFMELARTTATRLGNKDTRDMTNALRTKVERKKNEVTGILSDNIHYTIYQEFIKPFMRPGILDNIKHYGKLLAKYL